MHNADTLTKCALQTLTKVLNCKENCTLFKAKNGQAASYNSSRAMTRDYAA